MKTLLIVTLLSLSINTFAQNHIRIGSGYEVSYTPEESYLGRHYYDNKLDNDLVIDFGNVKWRYQLRFEYKNISLHSNTHIYMNYGGKCEFKPSMAIFDLDLRYDIKKFRITLGHRCVHPIMNGGREILNSGKAFGGYRVKISLSYNIK